MQGAKERRMGVWSNTPQAFREPQGRRRGGIEGYLPKVDNAADDTFLVIRVCSFRLITTFFSVPGPSDIHQPHRFLERPDGKE